MHPSHCCFGGGRLLGALRKRPMLPGRGPWQRGLWMECPSKGKGRGEAASIKERGRLEPRGVRGERRCLHVHLGHWPSNVCAHAAGPVSGFQTVEGAAPHYVVVRGVAHSSARRAYIGALLRPKVRFSRQHTCTHFVIEQFAPHRVALDRRQSPRSQPDILSHPEC